jgi:D-alanyl-D-alanine carboxypeptidase/D-alanyl-D-alanine-endopeptidase (penicillin-binding protein 4)
MIGSNARPARTAVRATLVLAAALLSATGCAARGGSSPDIPVRIDPVAIPFPELEMPEVPLPAARAELLRLVDSLTSDSTFRMAHWGVLIMDPEVGDTLVSVNADKLFMPASNQKLVTGATALTLLGPEYTWRTPVLLRGTLRGGTFRGDVVLVGSGDPSWSEAMRGGDALSALHPIADALAARGVRRIVGRIVAEGDAFPDASYGFGWGWDDFDFGYSAGIDELQFNEGFFRVIVHAGRRAGAKATARTAPLATYPTLRVTATTRAADDTTTARLHPLEVLSDSTASVLEVRGTIPLGDSVVITRAYRHSSDAARTALRELLVARGIRFTSGAAAPARARTDTLVVLQSPTLREVNVRMQKPSQNQIAETIFKTMGREVTGVGSADSARAAVERQLLAWGIGAADAAVRDGSGLSRHDYLTPRAVVRLLTVMQQQPTFTDFYAALPIAGVDGTIGSRMRGTPAQGNLRAKTGTLDKARSLSGYVTTRDGHQLVFSMLCNNWVGSVRDVERVQDAIGAWLANATMADLRVAMPQ